MNDIVRILEHHLTDLEVLDWYLKNLRTQLSGRTIARVTMVLGRSRWIKSGRLPEPWRYPPSNTRYTEFEAVKVTHRWLTQRHCDWV